MHCTCWNYVRMRGDKRDAKATAFYRNTTPQQTLARVLPSLTMQLRMSAGKIIDFM